MGFFAVIDTETNWHDQVMSIGAVIADEVTFQVRDAKYYVITPEYLVGGMYDQALVSGSNCRINIVTRQQALAEFCEWLSAFCVTDLFAYNAPFDRNHLPELSACRWHDIIRVAAYRQNNPKIPACAECFSTGRMKRNYGVEPMLQMLSGRCGYHETHNALHDAMDELEIMKLLGRPPGDYPCL